MKASLEFKVGLMTMMALLVLMFALLFINNFQLGAGGKVVTVQFNFLGGLKTNAPVQYAGGIKVGIVKDIRLGDNKALVDMLITNPDLKLRKDSKVSLYSDGLLGSRYVQINADLGKEAEVEKGDVLIGQDANNLDETFAELGDVMETFEQMMGDPKAKANFLHSFDNLSKATDNMLALSISSREKINQMLADLAKSSASAPKLMASAQKLSDNLEALINALNRKDVASTMKNVTETMKTMNELTQNIREGKGAVGVLLKDEQVADDIKSLVEELKAHPWKLLWKN